MTPEEQDHVYRLCERIVIEQDLLIFDELVRELNQILSAKRERMREDG